jgi:hypothetical protein
VWSRRQEQLPDPGIESDVAEPLEKGRMLDMLVLGSRQAASTSSKYHAHDAAEILPMENREDMRFKDT